jgi:hypothetical protein
VDLQTLQISTQPKLIACLYLVEQHVGGKNPQVVSMLIVPEQMLIALEYTHGYIYKPYPRVGEGQSIRMHFKAP